MGAYTAMLYAMWYLLENYGSDPEATYLVNNREMYFVPVVNVDGFLYNIQSNPKGGGMWRKNRRKNSDGSFGVDINRNYPYQWGYDNSGSSPTPSSDNYRGASARSEPETQAVMNFLKGRQIKTLLFIHTYQGLYLYPYGYANVQPEFADVFKEYAAIMSSANRYSCGPVFSTIYPVNEAAIDWHLNALKIIAFSPEIGRSDFWPVQDMILREAAENLPAILQIAWGGGGQVKIKD